MLAKVLQRLPGVPFQLHGGRVDFFGFSANKFGWVTMGRAFSPFGGGRLRNLGLRPRLVLDAPLALSSNNPWQDDAEPLGLPNNKSRLGRRSGASEFNRSRGLAGTGFHLSPWVC